MKCLDTNCHRTARIGSDYCSDICAPTAPRNTRNIKSGFPTPFSSSTEYIGPSNPSDSDGSTGPNETENVAPIRSRSSNSALVGVNTRSENLSPVLEFSARARPVKTANEAQKSELIPGGISNGGAGTPKIETANCETLTEEKTPMTHDELSIEPAPTLPPATLDSTSLIGESIKDLRSMLSAVAGNVTEKQNARVDPMVVMSGAACAKGITNLMRLQLEFMKFQRNIGE